MLLTSMFWEWSGMASVGLLYLALIAPVLMGVVVYNNKRNDYPSEYFRLAHNAGKYYFVIAPVVILLSISVE